MQRPPNEYNRQILEAIASGERVTQRGLSSRLGVALGLTNLLIRRLVAKGYVKITGLGTRHVGYLLTVKGWELLTQATRDSLENTLSLYTETRELIVASLSSVSARCAADAAGAKCIVFYGAGDVAEIAYVSMQRTDLTLVGVIDDRKTGRFFDLTISKPSQLSGGTLAGTPYAHIVVTSVRHSDEICRRLRAHAIPPECVSTIDPLPAAQRNDGLPEPIA